MKRFVISSIWVAGLALLCQAGSFGQASDPPKAEVNMYCPVVGMPGIKGCRCATGGYCSLRPHESCSLKYNGGKLQFCCDGCLKAFKESPAKFAVTANHQLAATKQAEQRSCPLCGGKVDPSQKVVIAGVEVRFCSEACTATVGKANAADRANLVFGEKGFTRGFAMKDAPK